VFCGICLYSQSPALSFGRRVSWWAFGESIVACVHFFATISRVLWFVSCQQFLPLFLLVCGYNYGPVRIEYWLLCEMLCV
jgi:hypothetical protein